MNVEIITVCSVIVGMILGISKVYTYPHLKSYEEKFKQKIKKELSLVAKNASIILKKEGDSILVKRISDINLLQYNLDTGMNICYPVNPLLSIFAIGSSLIFSIVTAPHLQIFWGMITGTIILIMLLLAIVAIVVDFKVKKYINENK